MKIKLTFMIGMLSACTLLLQAQSIDEETARAEACRFSTNGLQNSLQTRHFPTKPTTKISRKKNAE